MAAPYRFLFILLPVLALAVIVVSLPRTAAAPEAAPEARPTPELVHIPTEAERAFEQELEEIAASLDGTVGVAVTDVETGRSYAIRGDDWFPQQSVSKLWVALTALDEVDEGRLELDEAVAIGPKDLTLFHQPIRDLVQARGAFRTDYADLMQRALTGSDNTANDRILRRVGGAEAVEDFLAAKKITGVRFGADERTKQSAIAGLRWNQAFSVGNAFFDARDRVPDAARRAAFEGYLADPIDGATPVGITEALARLHKTGTGQFFDGEQSGYNDIGILTSPEGHRYTLAVLIARTREPTLARMRMMQEVTRATAQFDLERANEDPPEVVAQPVG